MAGKSKIWYWKMCVVRMFLIHGGVWLSSVCPHVKGEERSESFYRGDFSVFILLCLHLLCPGFL